MNNQTDSILVLKTNWKQPWQEKGHRFLRIVVGFLGILIPLQLLISTLLGHDSLFEDEIPRLVILCIVVIFVTGYISCWIPMLITYFCPETYEISKESGHLRITCNKKEKLSVDITDIFGVTFIRTVLGSTQILVGNPNGDQMVVDYRINAGGRLKKKRYTMELRWLKDEDRIRLRMFL